MITLLPCSSVRRGELTRRDLLRMGAASTMGLSLPDLLRAEAARPVDFAARATAKNCIYIFLCGGPSQLDMWDPKPDAPTEIRGPFMPLATNVPGVHLTELLPRTARHADRFSIIRSMHHDHASHDVGILYTLFATAKPPTRQADPPTRQDHPGIGATLHHLLGAPGVLPAWVSCRASSRPGAASTRDRPPASSGRPMIPSRSTSRRGTPWRAANSRSRPCVRRRD